MVLKIVSEVGCLVPLYSILMKGPTAFRIFLQGRTDLEVGNLAKVWKEKVWKEKKPLESA